MDRASFKSDSTKPANTFISHKLSPLHIEYRKHLQATDEKEFFFSTNY